MTFQNQRLLEFVIFKKRKILNFIVEFLGDFEKSKTLKEYLKISIQTV